MLYWKLPQFWKKWGSRNCLLKVNERTIATQKVISTVINLKNYFPLLKGSDLEKKQKRSCSYIAVYVSMIPGITRSSCFSRERASHMQSSFQDEMSFRVVRGVISICFHPLLLKIRNENELLYMVYLLHISWHSLVADDGFHSNGSIKILIGS